MLIILYIHTTRPCLVVVEEVGHLEIPMDDPSSVEVIDGLQQLDHDALDLFTPHAYAEV